MDFLFKTQEKGKKESLFRYAETMTTATMPSIEEFCKSLLNDNPGPLENYTANDNFECPGNYVPNCLSTCSKKGINYSWNGKFGVKYFNKLKYLPIWFYNVICSGGF